MAKFTVDFTGNLGQDAKIVQKGGSTYVQLSVATRHFDRITNVESTEWMSCIAFDPKTLGIARGGHLRKGMKVAVSGKLQIKTVTEKSRTEEEGENGEKIITFTDKKNVFFNVNVTELDIMSNTGNTPSPDADTQDGDAPASDEEAPF